MSTPPMPRATSPARAVSKSRSARAVPNGPSSWASSKSSNIAAISRLPAKASPILRPRFARPWSFCATSELSSISGRAPLAKGSRVGWLNFLFGPPSRDQFAKLVMAELRKFGESGEMRFDAEQFLIDRGGEGFINLSNLYHEYCQTPRGERAG